MSACLDCGGSECICSYKAKVRKLTEERERLLVALNGILQYGTRVVNEAENPIGVQIEGTEVLSERLAADWHKAECLSDDLSPRNFRPSGLHPNS